MKLKIERSWSQDSCQWVVGTATRAEIVAPWHGRAPMADATYDVELETSDEKTWGAEDCIIIDGEPAIYRVGNDHVVQGFLEAASSDEFATIRVGHAADDPLIAIIIEGEPPPLGTAVRITIHDLELYDANT